MNHPSVVLSGSHLTPAQAVGEKLKEHSWPVNYFSSKSAKFNRHQLFLSSLSLFKLPVSIFKSWYYLVKLKPKVVVSFGGFSALPVCVAAKLLGLPLIIHEQTFAAGLTSRITALIADKIAISWLESQRYFPKKKTVLTGNPLRQEILNLYCPTPSVLRPVIFITAGHQGSKFINQTVAEILPKLLLKYKVYHQFGLIQSSASWERERQFQHPQYILKRWFSAPELASILRQASLVISRSGINTVTELAYLSKPAILIPLLTAQKNEQLTNARFLKSLGLAIILSQKQLTGAKLQKTITKALRCLPQASTRKLDFSLVANAADNLYQVIRPFLP
ncbi:MAG: UDP-N-acetylglucosamine--N-acetylmuramyl-(pentapeptide) pyrophosphoryl-undecaprenol N-acetylglucosamine transferase [Candidatus Beckwithbacteria bacterium]|nr:UDP-N-acetylglucosamine--N-acetylmuramyl-(pentapeptide) pyrophosphoryl-undecaprenol N-acetylglucosamine transferase [Candidatus Beckwithbacteria bacterium]